MNTTVVHPSWHNTGILGGDKNVKMLNNFGIYPDPASNVSDLVLDNVFNARSGQIFVPKGEKSKAGMRNWPLWTQDLLGAVMKWQMKRMNRSGSGDAFEFGKGGLEFE